MTGAAALPDEARLEAGPDAEPERSRLLRLASTAPALAIAATVGLLAAAEGGYFAPAWGWATLAFLWVLGLGLVTRVARRPSPPELVFAGALAAYAAWTGLSGLWSSAPALAVAELQRALVYVIAVAAAAVVLRWRDSEVLLGGLLGVITVASAYALVTRFWPSGQSGEVDPVTRYRLAEPLGYWNALGIFAALGLVLAVGLVHETRFTPMRMAAASTVAVLAPTVYFTFGRGAWLAAAFGVGMLAIATARRLHLLATLAVVAPWPAAAVWLASRSDALARPQENLAAASRDGRNLSLLLALLAAGAALGALGLARGERRVVVPRRLRLAGAAVAALVVVAAAVTVLAWQGSPGRILEKARNQFETSPPKDAEANPTSRLFAVSGNGRPEQWRVAVEMFRDSPWVGSGAGTFEREWVLRRDRPFYIRDAHNLYLEAGGELGVVGVSLLAVLLLVPFGVALRARGRPLVATGVAGLAAYATHAGLDWDWELPAVTLVGLLCGLAALLAARGEPLPLLPSCARVAVGLGSVALAGAAVVGLIGNSAVRDGSRAADEGRISVSEAEGRLAARWLPWSPEPWELIGRAQLARGERAAARSSFERALEQDSGDWQLWALLAVSSEGAVRERALDHAVELNPLGDVEAEVNREP